MWLELRMSLFALRLLSRRVGFFRLPRLLWSVLRGQRRGEPWSDLPPPTSKRQEACRAQMGQLVLLHDAIAERLGATRATEVAGELVRESAVIQLRSFIPKKTLLKYREIPAEARETILSRTLDKFPNATIDSKTIEADRFEFHVGRCEFVELAKAIGRPEMAQLFCSGDALYFERHLPETRFDRPQMLSEGGAYCDFRIRWSEDQ